MNFRFRFSRIVGVGMVSVGVCLILSSASFAAEPVTFAKDVAPILQEKCQECHHTGSMAPMSLVTYEETRPWAKAIRDRVTTRQMPPWHIDTIAAWVDQGALVGNLKDMPAPREWGNEDQWKGAKELGQPDIVVKSTDWTMPAHHQDVWWRPTSDIGLTKPRWVKAVEVRPDTLPG